MTGTHCGKDPFYHSAFSLPRSFECSAAEGKGLWVWYKYGPQEGRGLLSFTYLFSTRSQFVFPIVHPRYYSMPSDPNQLPDDIEPTREVDYSKEGDHDHEESDNDEKSEFDPVGLSKDEMKFLGDNITLEEIREWNQRVDDFYDSCDSVSMAAIDAATLEIVPFFKAMLSIVTDRVEAASTAVPPTVTPIEQEDDRGEEQEEEEEEQDEEHARPTEGAMSEAGTVPSRSETPTQP